MRSTNLADHPIEGYTNDGHQVSIPLISRIAPPLVPGGGELWMGGCVNSVVLDPDQYAHPWPIPYFRYVLSLYPQERYALPPACHREEVYLYDANELPAPPEELYRLAALVNTWRAEGSTLVHCQAGLNRSGLITALALILAGATPVEAVATLRGARDPYVLCNQMFANWLSGQEHAVWGGHAIVPGNEDTWPANYVISDSPLEDA
jgi:hypothetical protein